MKRLRSEQRDLVGARPQTGGQRVRGQEDFGRDGPVGILDLKGEVPGGPLREFECDSHDYSGGRGPRNTRNHIQLTLELYNSIQFFLLLFRVSRVFRGPFSPRVSARRW